MTDTLEALTESIRWLAPDAELDRLGPDARLFIDSIADELAAAWQPLTRKELSAPGVFVTRSANEALARWTHACVESARAFAMADKPAWFDAHSALVTRRLELEQKGDGLIDAVRAFRAAIERRTIALAPEWTPAWSLLLPGFFTAYRHTLWRRANASEPSSPWSPLLALWSRGTWPVLAPNGELILWIPSRRDGTIVLNADHDTVTPSNIKASMLFGGEHLPPGRLPIVLAVSGARMSLHPVGERSYFDIDAGLVGSGTPPTASAATIAREPSERGAAERFVVTVREVGRVRVNGAPLPSFVLTPGDEYVLEGSKQQSALYFLGARSDDGAAHPSYRATEG